MSFRFKTVVGIAFIEAVFLLVLVWQASLYLQRSGERAKSQHAVETSQLFALLAKNAVIASDMATLDEIVKQISILPHVRYIRVIDDQGVLAQAGDAAVMNRGFAADRSIDQVDDEIFDVSANVAEGGYEFGRVQLGISTLDISRDVQEARGTLISIAIGELLMVALVSWWFGSYLTRGLQQLKSAAVTISQGGRNKRVEVKGRDELSVTAQAFNLMVSKLNQEQEALSENKRDLEELNQQVVSSELYLRTVLDSVVDGIVSIDSKGIISRINRSGEVLFGYEPGELLGKNVHCLMPSPHREAHDGYLARYLAGGKPSVIGAGRVVEGLRKDGSCFPMHLSVSEMTVEGKSFFVGLIQDKTLSNQLEAEVRRSSKIKSMITDASLDSMVTVDMDGIVVEYNAVAEKTFGWSRDEVMGKLMEDFIIPPEMREAHRHGMARFKQHGSGPLIGGRVEVDALRKNGERFPIELSLVAAEIDGERLATAFLRDITARKQAEQELIDAKEAAEEASLAKSRFLSQMSHEIRSPLNAVLGAVNLVAERIQQPEHQRLLNTAQSSGMALLSVINEVLDFSKIEAGHVTVMAEKVNLKDLVEDVLNGAYARLYKRDLDLICHVDPAVGEQIITDPVRVRQLINILVDNAVKFTDNGVVVVDIQRVGLATGDGGIEVSVHDTGVGIPDDCIQSVFNEFEQVDATQDSRFGGTGLGLTIAKRLVELLKGDIGVESQPDKGSRFYFSIPVIFLDNPVACTADITGKLHLITTNLALREVFADKMQAMGGQFQGHQSLSGFRQHLQDNVLIPSESVLIDDRCFESAHSDLKWLAASGIDFACLIGPGKQLPDTLKGHVCIHKPLTCRQMLAYLLRENVPVDASKEAIIDPVNEGRLLLVEDVAANRLVAGEMLRSRGFDVTMAEDGLDALEKAQSSVFDVILMDVRMPRMNGIDAVIQLRQRGGLNAATPVIALTANAEQSEMERCRQAGMDDFVSKPFDSHRLVTVIQECMQGRRSAAVVEEEAAGEYLSEPVLEQLVRDTSQDALVPMLDMFLDELQLRYQAIVAAMASCDAIEVGEQAHALKSCSGTFGAKEVQRLAKELEDAGRTQDMTLLTPLAQALAPAVAGTEKAFRKYREQASA